MKTPEIIDAFVDPAKCPLCGQDNGCRNICGDINNNKNCWCKDVSFPKQLFDTVPLEAKKKPVFAKPARWASTTLSLRLNPQYLVPASVHRFSPHSFTDFHRTRSPIVIAPRAKSRGNPGSIPLSVIIAPDFASLHPGYAYIDRV